MTNLKELTPEGLAANLLFEANKLEQFEHECILCEELIFQIKLEFTTRGLHPVNYVFKSNSL